MVQVPGAGREDSDGNEIASESQTGAVHLMTYGLRLERTESMSVRKPLKSPTTSIGLPTEPEEPDR